MCKSFSLPLPECWWCPLTCRLADYEVRDLIHAQLACVATAVLLTKTLYLLPLHGGQARHTDGAALQYGTQVVLHTQIRVLEQTEE